MAGSRRFRWIIGIWLLVLVALGAALVPRLLDDSNFRGHLLDGNNDPVPGITIYALDASGNRVDSAVTDSDGAFRITSHPAIANTRDHHFEIVLREDVPAWRTIVNDRQYIRMFGGSKVREDIWLPSEVAVTGRVVDAAGEPLGGAWVSVHPDLTEGLGISRQTNAYADGTFVVFLDEADMSLRRVRASVHPVGFMPAYEAVLPDRAIEWDFGRIVHFGDVVVEPAGLAVGYVVDEANDPVEGATVTVFSIGPEVPDYQPEGERDTFWGQPWSGSSGARVGGPRVLSLSTTTDGDGAFEVTVLLPADEVIAVVLPHDRPGVRISVPAEQLAVGQSPAALEEIRLPDRLTTRFRLVDAEGHPVASMSNVFVNWVDPLRDRMDVGVANLSTDADGWTSTSAIGPDAWYRLHLNFHYAPTKAIQIADGDEIVLEAE